MNPCPEALSPLPVLSRSNFQLNPDKPSTNSGIPLPSLGKHKAHPRGGSQWGNLGQAQGIVLAPRLGPASGEPWKCQGMAGAYFRINVMVSFRSFPWKGREPVSISNCKGQGSVRLWSPSPMSPTSSHLGHSAPFPGFLLDCGRAPRIRNCDQFSFSFQSEHRKQC